MHFLHVALDEQVVVLWRIDFLAILISQCLSAMVSGKELL